MDSSRTSSIIGAKEKYDFYSAPAVVEEATVQPLRDLHEAGIPAILWDRDTAPEGRDYRLFCTITNNVEVGRVQAETLMEALEQTDKSQPYKIICCWGHPGASSAEDRREGALMKLNQLEEQGKVEVVGAQYHEGWSRSAALDFVSTILGKEGGVDAVLGSNDDIALGAISAAKSAGLTPGEDIYVVVGCDAISEAQEAIANGEMYATIAQANYAMAYWSILAGFQNVVYDWEAPQDIIPAPVTAVTPQNVEGFTLERPLMDAWSQYGNTVEELPEEL